MTDEVKLVAMVPMAMSDPPTMTTNWNPQRLVRIEERGPADPEETYMVRRLF